jgi:hypothetical protein
MLAGIGGPIGMAEPLLQLGCLLVPLDGPLMGGQLPALGYQRPFTRARQPLLGLLGPARRLVAAPTLHDHPRSCEQAGQFDASEHGHQAAARQASLGSFPPNGATSTRAAKTTPGQAVGERLATRCGNPPARSNARRWASFVGSRRAKSSRDAAVGKGDDSR